MRLLENHTAASGQSRSEPLCCRRPCAPPLCLPADIADTMVPHARRLLCGPVLDSVGAKTRLNLVWDERCARPRIDPASLGRTPRPARSALHRAIPSAATLFACPPATCSPAWRPQLRCRTRRAARLARAHRPPPPLMEPFQPAHLTFEGLEPVCHTTTMPALLL